MSEEEAVKLNKTSPRRASVSSRDPDVAIPLIPTGDTELNIPVSELKEVDNDHPAIERKKSVVSVNVKSAGCYRFIGIGLTLLAGLLMSSSNVCAKWLKSSSEGKYDATLNTFVKYQGMTTLSLAHVIYLSCCTKDKVMDTVWPLNKKENLSNLFFLFIRASFGTAATVLLFQSYTYLDAADATTIVYCTPIATIFLARIFLKEPIGLVSVLVAILALCGVFFVSNPPFLTEQTPGKERKFSLIGVTLAFFAMIGMSCVFVTVRYLRKVHYGVVMVAYGYIGSIECIITALLLPLFGIAKPFVEVFILPKAWYDFFVMSIVAVFSMLGQTLLVLALKFENAGPVSLLRTCDIVFNFILQYFLLGTIPTVWSAVGALIVIAASLIFGFRKFVQTLPEGDPKKERFKVFLL